MTEVSDLTYKEKINYAKRVLIRHNLWRLGGDDVPTDPKELTKAMNIAIEVLDAAEADEKTGSIIKIFLNDMREREAK
jgi:hypothetical protein